MAKVTVLRQIIFSAEVTKNILVYYPTFLHCKSVGTIKTVKAH
jgi:hypothetical protein